MLNKLQAYFIIFILLLLSACYEELVGPSDNMVDNTGEYLYFDKATCFFDKPSGTFLYPLKTDFISSYSPIISYNFDTCSLIINGRNIINHEKNRLGDVKLNEAYPVLGISGIDTVFSYQLVFTALPVIHVNIDYEIVDEPKTICEITVNDPWYMNGDYYVREFRSFAGIEIRGGVSQGYPKKSYNVEFWNDEYGKEKNSFSLFQFRRDDDWIFDAMYIDRSRMRNRLCWDIWSSFDKMEYYLSENPHLGIDGRFIEVFINRKYNGIYCLNERIDAKQCRNYGIPFFYDQGLIYKAKQWGSPVMFNSCPDTSLSFFWDGWEQEYPDDETRWRPLYQFTAFFLNSSDNEFIDKVQDYIHLESFIDYYIFLNLISGFDNTSKNTFFIRPDDHSPFIIVPWDMDGTLGRNWDSTLTGHHYILTNNLYDRLIELDVGQINNRLKNRWDELKNDQLAFETLQERMQDYAALFNRGGVIERENRTWDAGLDIDAEMDYIMDWLQKRIDYLDDYFNGL